MTAADTQLEHHTWMSRSLSCSDTSIDNVCEHLELTYNCRFSHYIIKCQLYNEIRIRELNFAFTCVLNNHRLYILD